MKKTIYMSFDVEADSYQEAETKVDSIFKNIEHIIPPESGVQNIIKTRKFVNKVKI